MRFIDEFRDPELAQRLAARIRQESCRPLKLMEFCGTHTVSMFRYGIRQLLPQNIEMLSGPGCPVCVTPVSDLDKAIAIAGMPGVIVTTFGDMFKVPGSQASLRSTRAEGADIRIVYSVRDSLDTALANPSRRIVFLGVGFETTAPTVAASILEAKARGITNYLVLCLHKVCPPVMKAILDLGEIGIQGIMCPGHVSAIIGTHPYEFIPREYGIACVVSGFEPIDMLQSIWLLVQQVQQGRPGVAIAYGRGVTAAGNKRAQELMHQVFEACDGDWRGVGTVRGSGLALRPEYAEFDAEKVLPIPPTHSKEPPGCLCGAVLRGVKTPPQCPLFGRRCTPETPVGPCMVSSEGTCAAYFLYGAVHAG